MTLNAGARLGPYEIVAPLGVGGMGEVYRARDTKLGRDVALKIIPEAFALDVDRVARFRREAQVLASLNDPHIAAIYGFEDSGQTHALVLELVEGETLAELIGRRPEGLRLPGNGSDRGMVAEGLQASRSERRPGDGSGRPSGLPIDEALHIARQIAEALEAAHEHGIIHRDLKPANIKVTPDGIVKVLDFGLAKLNDPNASNGPNGPNDPNVLTVTSPAMMTGAGMILGTAAYMAPEQAKGRPADKRSDVWAFGCVLYEMLTGRRAFDGEDMVDVLGAVARLEPDWHALPPALPSPVRTLLQTCLVKDRRRRVAEMSTALFVLDHAAGLAARPAAASGAPPPSKPAWSTAVPLAAAVVAGMVIATAGAIYLRPAPVQLPESRLEIATPPGRLSYSKLSPDGRKVVFSAAAEGKAAQLWLRSFESETAQPLAATDNAVYPFWSPDSRSIGFFAAGKLMRLDLSGGGSRALADAPDGVGGAWSPDGTIVFTPTATSPLLRVAAAGGTTTPVTRLNSPAQASHRFPEFLPDGRHFLFYIAGTANIEGIYVGSLDASDTRRLLESDSAGVFAAPEYVVFRRQDNLLAQRVDLKTLEITGESMPVADRVSGDQGTRAEIAVSTSRAGSIAYRAPIDGARQLTWVDRAGRQTGTVGGLDAEGFTFPGIRISPDGRNVALQREIDGNLDVWLVDTARGVLRRFTNDPAGDGFPVWAPDSSRIALYSRRSGPQNLWVKGVDRGVEEHLRESTANEVPTDWSANGEFLLFTTGGRDLWALRLAGQAQPIAVANTTFAEGQGRFSPDGRSVAYQSDESGRNEVYAVAFPPAGAPTQVSTSGGTSPQWRADGRELFYLSPDNRVMAVPVAAQANGGRAFGTPVALFTLPPGAVYDVARDGQRFLVNKFVGANPTPPITIIQNWRPRN